MYFLRLSVHRWFVTAGPGVRFQRTVRDSQRTADYTFHYTNIHRAQWADAEPRQCPRCSDEVTQTQLSLLLSAAHSLTSSQRLRFISLLFSDRTTWRATLVMTCRRLGGAFTWGCRWYSDRGVEQIGGGPAVRKISCGEVALKRRSIMWSRGIISSLEMYFYSEWLCVTVTCFSRAESEMVIIRFGVSLSQSRAEAFFFFFFFLQFRAND